MSQKPQILELSILDYFLNSHDSLETKGFSAIQMKIKIMHSQRIHCEKTRPSVSSEFIIKIFRKKSYT